MTTLIRLHSQQILGKRQYFLFPVNVMIRPDQMTKPVSNVLATVEGEDLTQLRIVLITSANAVLHHLEFVDMLVVHESGHTRWRT